MNSSPLFKIVIPFIVGILLGIYIPVQGSIINICICLILLILICFCTFLQTKIQIFQNTILYSFFLFSLLVLLGYNYTIYQSVTISKNKIVPYIQSVNILDVWVDEKPVESKKSIKAICQVRKMKDSLGWHKASSKIIVYLEKDSIASKLQYGDRLLLITTLKEVDSPKNSYEFDYKNYLQNKHICYQSYVRSNEWVCIKKAEVKNIYSFAYSLRERLLQSFKSEELSQEESAVASAILLGWDKDIDAVTLQAYSTAGITHLLSVSGLHVGILCLLVGKMFFFLRTPRQKRVKTVIQFCFIWLFAFVTGLVPSVLRATIMFSFIIMGQVINQKTYIYNNLSASALFLLLIDPYVITNVGFQLSYLGVLGIVTIQPILIRFFHSKYKVINYIMELMCVSVAAQLATMPFTMYYFHQFPTYFLLANVIIIPFSGIVLATALFVALFSWIPFVGKLSATILSFEIYGMNKVVQYIEFLPKALIDNINFTLVHAVLMCTVIIFLCAFLIRRNVNYFMATLCGICLFLSYEIQNRYKYKYQQSWTIYHLGRKYTALEFTIGERALLLMDKNLLTDSLLQNFYLKNNHIQSKIKRIEKSNVLDTTIFKEKIFFKNNNFIQFGNDKIVLLDSKINYIKSRHPVKVNYVVLFENPKITIQDICSHFKFDTLIITASNSNKNIKKWILECHNLKIPHISIHSSKAFVRKIH